MMKDSTLTAGVDIGDRESNICIVDEEDGKIVVIEETKIRTSPESVRRYFGCRQPMVVAMETGTHSAWMSRTVQETGHEAIVANARKLRFIYSNDQKDDRTDAEMIARVARMDPALLSPIQHRADRYAPAMALLRSRDALIRARTVLINHVRGIVKTSGTRLPSCSAEQFHKLIPGLPEPLVPVLETVMKSIEGLTDQIRALDRQVEQVAAKEYPETKRLRQVPGIGPITALAYVLTIADPWRFKHTRSVGSYVGLVPRRAQSGEHDPQLNISKAGNRYLRRLLVTGSHRILGPFGPDSDLRRFGMRIAQSGGKRAKRRAVVAVARKLSVLLLSLLKSGEEYELVRQTRTPTKAESVA